MIFPVMMDDKMLSQTVRWEVIQFSKNIYVMLIELILELCGMSYLRYYMPSAFICQKASPSCILYLVICTPSLIGLLQKTAVWLLGIVWVTLLSGMCHEEQMQR